MLFGVNVFSHFFFFPKWGQGLRCESEVRTLAEELMPTTSCFFSWHFQLNLHCSYAVQNGASSCLPSVFVLVSDNSTTDIPAHFFRTLGVTHLSGECVV